MRSSASPSSAAYGPVDRLFHRLALDWRPVLETSFDIESALFGRIADAKAVTRPIFVCGLARAGTSLVARLISAAAGMAFPSYRDMPLPLAPNLWARLGGGRRRVASAERGHGDGMTHDLDTPEAIEEVFWRCFEGRRYLRRDGLAAEPPSPETLANFRGYMARVVLRGRGTRYLSKNNNNILRVQALSQAIPDALFVHPFRHPISQAASLHAQHRRACELQRADRFRRQYSEWLAHHEFGPGHRPFLVGSSEVEGDRERLEYWLAAWERAYAHLLHQTRALRSRQFFVDYDQLCRSPESVLGALAEFLGLDRIDGKPVRPPRRREDGGAAGSTTIGDGIYRSLLDLAPAR